ncbi:hypothetical protein [Rhodoplanes roseus]|uniref:Uncharacterized protein n=1 Tax=Rhodoplanes roseus TaxID=29409 RepID=A0A327L7D4_9BRAD|nr:hypothetical protein [Rhodoplanes roseus]RAI46014.1 hypothetical protein CH341_00820 [Rhodoplanes roseus]
METLRRTAFEIVLRACLFGSLAIFCVMVALSFEPRAAFKAGGFLTLVMVGVLLLKAAGARTKNYRHTEMWLYLPEEHRPPPAYAQFVSAMVMRETYLFFARRTALVSIVMWSLALLLALAGL